MAPLPGRDHHLLCPLVPPLSVSLRACGRIDAGARPGPRWELWSGGPVQAYGPELERRCRPYLKLTSKSYRVDETYIQIKGEDKYLYRAVDKHGQTVDFLLTPRRDARAAKRFLREVLTEPENPHPRVINVDKNPAYPAAVKALKEEGTLRRRCRGVPVQVLE
jgi:transposase, IS6 family